MDHHAKINWDLTTDTTNTTPSSSSSSNHMSDSTMPSSSSANDPFSDCQRTRVLERNRAAAARCRQRKKQWIEDLKTRHEELKDRNQCLYQTRTHLQNQVFKLKNELLLHEGCDCQAIQSFIQTSLMKDALEQTNNTTIPNEFPQQTQHPTFQ
ncbi:hypothetical protein O0I10_001128 [Lichtheimia ornata]|uniref:BZIP domain-containing protein n=1 Tax=Lichtheimia ornata TaxID=688661 RepID=A0AAD7Y384_9FUNG|nr:uncharacterized protein O0I10_001128 [Lichtheimia ornata]KAJ8662952.1 hypothetical protein O0I10_001128 [Lichtheimia ornata]